MANLELSQQTTGLIGGLGMTRVKVYDQRVAPDGKHSGCPHIHAICAEAYYIVSGKGSVELHTLDKGFRTVLLKAGDYFQFPPNVLHRIVSDEGLSVLGLMSNSGLAENGDARIYFGPEVDEEPDSFSYLVSLASTGIEGALVRRDAAVRAYQKLIDLWDSDRANYFRELERFVDLHRNNVLSEADKFSEHVQSGPIAWGKHTETRLSGNKSSFDGDRFVFNGDSGDARMGMCGTLHPVQLGGLEV
ncbi:MAG: cupin domain-containing protein [Verrucomicrobiota bacterium]